MPVELLQRYTLVGIDRRGAGIDDLDCGPAVARSAFVNIDPGGDGSLTALNALLEQARQVVQDCYLVHAGALSGYRTASTAWDIEQARAALGVTQMSAIGVGDGATALSIWARTHPAAAGRLVLDGPPNAALDEPDAAEARAAAAESAFDAFAAACAAEPTCPLGADPRAAVSAFVGRLRAQPITATDGRRLTAGMTVTALLTGLSEPAGWPDLAAALGQAQGGVPDALISRLVPLVTRGGEFDIALATDCNDVQRRMTPAEVGDLTRRWRTAYPLFGATMAQRLLACGPWPTASPAPVPDPGSQLPPVLVIGTAHDPRGPLETPVGWRARRRGAVPQLAGRRHRRLPADAVRRGRRRHGPGRREVAARRNALPALRPTAPSTTRRSPARRTGRGSCGRTASARRPRAAPASRPAPAARGRAGTAARSRSSAR